MSLPEAFILRTKELLGDEFSELEKALEQPSPTSIRVNNKSTVQPSNEKVAWCDSGYYLAERPLFTADPLFHGGTYYVQEASSMFLQQAVLQYFKDAEVVLDLCAAPGGKSTLISQTLSEDSLLVSNEIVRSRAYILAENIIKWGNPNCVVTNNEPKDFGKLTGFFDAVVVDAPCSGEGMFRKDLNARAEWSVKNVENCVIRQREILTDVWAGLKKEGILVYSTCTFNRQENEENVKWMCEELGAEVLQIDLNGNSDIISTDYGYRFYPNKIKGEGFFLSLIRKTSGYYNTFNYKTDKKSIHEIKANFIEPYALQKPENWSFFNENNQIKAYNKKQLNRFLYLNKVLKVMHAGVLCGEMKGKDFIPATALALSKMLNRESCVSVEVDYRTAISFLKAEAIQLENVPKGYLLICYKSITLGWVKNVGNRCNNLYPQEWRIRMKI